MNRNYTWVKDASILEEMRAVSPRIHSYADYRREFMTGAEKALPALDREGLEKY